MTKLKELHAVPLSIGERAALDDRMFKGVASNKIDGIHNVTKKQYEEAKKKFNKDDVALSK